MSSQPPKRRGKFIVFEGLDKAGKSTQCARLVSKLKSRGHTVESLRFPDRTTPIGRLIDGYLRSSSSSSASTATAYNTSNSHDKEEHGSATHTLPPSHSPSDQAIHLLFSANRWEHAAAIESILTSGTSIICDRYYYSGCVYSAAKGIPGLDLAWARAPDVGLPRPDLCLLLDVSADVAMKRAGAADGDESHSITSKTATAGVSTQSETSQERYETLAMQSRVRQLFEELRSGGGSDNHTDEADDTVVVDASASFEKVEEEILQRVLRVFEEVDAAGGEAPLRRVRAW